MRWRAATTLKARMSQTSIASTVLRLERLWELPLVAVPDRVEAKGQRRRRRRSGGGGRGRGPGRLGRVIADLPNVLLNIAFAKVTLFQTTETTR